jgi:hypothetical protein
MMGKSKMVLGNEERFLVDGFLGDTSYFSLPSPEAHVQRPAAGCRGLSMHIKRENRRYGFEANCCFVRFLDLPSRQEDTKIRERTLCLRAFVA